KAAGLIPRVLANGINTGYAFALAASPTGYTITAHPVVYGSSGRRTFYSDETTVIRHNWSQEPATKASIEFNAPAAAKERASGLRRVPLRSRSSPRASGRSASNSIPQR